MADSSHNVKATPVKPTPLQTPKPSKATNKPTDVKGAPATLPPTEVMKGSQAIAKPSKPTGKNPPPSDKTPTTFVMHDAPALDEVSTTHHPSGSGSHTTTVKSPTPAKTPSTRKAPSHLAPAFAKARNVVVLVIQAPVEFLLSMPWLVSMPCLSMHLARGMN
ncbi:hypothetical protein Scep_018927 [Stephania cephalantha]|uniref:Uncharacterized protein n=1 Tax=Stephania cephalantha TaxID=152367 RepID=A0AAP0IA99_9MAGN